MVRMIRLGDVFEPHSIHQLTNATPHVAVNYVKLLVWFIGKYCRERSKGGQQNCIRPECAVLIWIIRT